MKSIRIWSYSGPHFPAFGLNADYNNSEYEHFLRSDVLQELSLPLYEEMMGMNVARLASFHSRLKPVSLRPTFTR